MLMIILRPCTMHVGFSREQRIYHERYTADEPVWVDRPEKAGVRRGAAHLRQAVNARFAESRPRRSHVPIFDPPDAPRVGPACFMMAASHV